MNAADIIREFLKLHSMHSCVLSDRRLWPHTGLALRGEVLFEFWHMNAPVRGGIREGKSFVDRNYKGWVVVNLGTGRFNVGLPGTVSRKCINRSSYISSIDEPDWFEKLLPFIVAVQSSTL